MYTMECYSAITEWNHAICDNLDEPRAYYAKWNKTEKEIPWLHLYVESKK